MTQSDRWRKRPPVVRYFEYANKLKELNPEIDWEPLSLLFVLPMPKSWSKKKRAEMEGEPQVSGGGGRFTRGMNSHGIGNLDTCLMQ